MLQAALGNTGYDAYRMQKQRLQKQIFTLTRLSTSCIFTTVTKVLLQSLVCLALQVQDVMAAQEMLAQLQLKATAAMRETLAQRT